MSSWSQRARFAKLPLNLVAADMSPLHLNRRMTHVGCDGSGIGERLWRNETSRFEPLNRHSGSGTGKSMNSVTMLVMSLLEF